MNALYLLPQLHCQLHAHIPSLLPTQRVALHIKFELIAAGLLEASLLLKSDVCLCRSSYQPGQGKALDSKTSTLLQQDSIMT